LEKVLFIWFMFGLLWSDLKNDVLGISSIRVV
jgi:hypothetical protein